MALSKEFKDALSDHYKNSDLYDPSKDPEQEVTTYKPKALCMGGSIEPGGYAEGGSVADDFTGPILSADTDTVKGDGAPPMPGMELPPEPPPVNAPPIPAPARIAPQPRLPLPGSLPPQAAPSPAAATPAAGSADYAQLIKALQPGLAQRLGQGAASGLGGLADAIETGVARAGNPGFQKGIDERAQAQRANLIEALRGKYEAGFKGAELGQTGQRIKEEGRHNKAAETIGSEEASARLAEAKAGLQQNALEAMGRLSESGGITGRVLGQPTQAQEAINALAERAGLRGPAPKIPTVTTKAQYDALPKGTHYQDGAGKQGVKK